MGQRTYLFLFLLFYFLIVFFLRSYLLWRRTGINPMTFDRSDDAHGYNGSMFKLISLLELIIVSVYFFSESWYPYLLPFWYLENQLLSLIGWVILHASLIWVFTAQLQMADSWRIGIDAEHKTALITSGLFSISRNPIFLGIIMANIGLFLVIPNAFTLLIFALSSVTINTQVRLEESFLKDTHKGTYSDYCQKVRRWI